MRRMAHASRWALLGFLWLGLFGLHASTSLYRSDAALKKLFWDHEADFEKLARMAEKDVHLVRIAPEFIWLDTDSTWPRKDLGISKERWHQYRKLFRRAGAIEGIVRDTDPPRIFFPIAARGSVAASQEQGIVYSLAALTPELHSVDEKLPAGLYDRNGHVVAFRPIKDHWYIYSVEF